MNELDSELVAQKLRESGFVETSSPSKAELIIVNTCAVRQKAEERAKKYIWDWKRKNKTIIAIGCVAQVFSDELRRMGADLVFGPRSYDNLPRVLSELKVGCVPKGVFSDGEMAITFSDISLKREVSKKRFSAFITIQEGCDKVCTFCIVPKTRGREISRPPDKILKEAKILEEQGVVEITLLGQNVDSYYHKGTDFADLLKLLDESTSFKRIRFTTSHPADINYKVVKVIANSKRITHWIHLPLQAGSTTILREMKRFYTKEEFVELAKMIRREIPDVTISTDIMVGYPGETDQDFQDTLDVVESVEFDNAYTFIYSKRPGTPAALRQDQVPREVAGKRLRVLIDVVNRKMMKRRKLMLGNTFELLIEGASRKDREWSKGKTKGNITCVVPGRFKPGTFLDVKIVDIRGLTPVGEPIDVLDSVGVNT